MASSAMDFDIPKFSYDIIDNFLILCTFQDPTGYPQILDIIDLSPL
jgi:hypothetical protein